MKKWSPEDRAQVASMLRGGFTGGGIAPYFGVTRHAIIGLVHRDPALKAIGFKTKPGHPGVRTPRVVKKPLTPVPTIFDCRSIPLMELQRGECKWPVNDAAPGEIHLFCGLSAEGSYCLGHARLSVGPGTSSERRANYYLMRRAA